MRATRNQAQCEGKGWGDFWGENLMVGGDLTPAGGHLLPEITQLASNMRGFVREFAR